MDQDVPDHDDGGDQEEHGADHRVELLHSRDGDVQEVDHEEHHVDDQDDEVESGDTPDLALVEAVSAQLVGSVAPGSAKERCNDDANHDLDDLDQASVGGQVSGVQAGHFCLFVSKLFGL